MADNAQPKPATPVKYKIKSGADTIAYPGLAVYTKEHLSGPDAELIVAAMKKTDAKKPAWNGNFEKLIEVVK